MKSGRLSSGHERSLREFVTSMLEFRNRGMSDQTNSHAPSPKVAFFKNRNHI